jgi:hypothetical protein
LGKEVGGATRFEERPLPKNPAQGGILRFLKTAPELRHSPDESENPFWFFLSPSSYCLDNDPNRLNFQSSIIKQTPHKII